MIPRYIDFINEGRNFVHTQVDLSASLRVMLETGPCDVVWMSDGGDLGDFVILVWQYAHVWLVAHIAYLHLHRKHFEIMNYCIRWTLHYL